MRTQMPAQFLQLSESAQAAPVWLRLVWIVVLLLGGAMVVALTVATARELRRGPAPKRRFAPAPALAALSVGLLVFIQVVL